MKTELPTFFFVILRILTILLYSDTDYGENTFNSILVFS